MNNPIPERVVNYNVYDDTDKLVGISGEITLPNFEAMTETISGAGIAGEYESALPGHFASQTIEIVFRVLMEKSFSLFKNSGKNLVLRAAQQSYDIAAGKAQHRPLKITIRYQAKSLNLGKLAVGGMTESANVLEVLYIKIEENGKVMLEYDKLNFVFIVDGTDLLGEIRRMI